MSPKAKKIFLLLSICIPFLIYCVYYYGMVIKDAPYKFKEFKSIEFQYGSGDSLVNKYNSKTGEYQYLNKRDSLVKVHLFLNNNELLDLHHKASDLGFWDFPKDERSNDTTTRRGVKPPRYIITFNYLHKSKRVVFDANYPGPQKLVDANMTLIKEIQAALNEAEARQKK